MTRPLRSLYFRGGHNEDDYVGCERSGADAIMIDLEEPCTPFSDAQRRRAREEVGQYLSARGTSEADPLYLVRIQSVSAGQAREDLEPIFCDALAGVMLPKISSPQDVAYLDEVLGALEDKHGMARGSKIIMPIFETASSMLAAHEIARISSRVQYCGGGASRYGDTQRALGYRWTPEGTETLFLRSKVLLDVRAAGVRYPMCGMWAGRVDDVEGVTAYATGLRNLGYYGMLINSVGASLIPIVHPIFTPPPEDVARWRELVRLKREAETTGGSVVRGRASEGELHVVHESQVVSAIWNLEWAESLERRDAALGKNLA